MHDNEARPIRASLDDLPPELARRVQAELDASERILWVGQPRPDLYAQGSGCAVAMGIFLAVFALFWMAIPLTVGLSAWAVGAAGDQHGGALCGLPFFCFALFGVPFFLVGGWMTTTPIWQRRLARKTCYVLTSRRALALETGLFGWMTVRSYSPKMLENLVRVEREDGCGSLIFQESLVGGGNRMRTRRFGFLGIEDVAHVEHLIRVHLLRPDAG